MPFTPITQQPKNKVTKVSQQDSQASTQRHSKVGNSNHKSTVKKAESTQKILGKRAAFSSVPKRGQSGLRS